MAISRFESIMDSFKYWGLDGRPDWDSLWKIILNEPADTISWESWEFLHSQVNFLYLGATYQPMHVVKLISQNINFIVHSGESHWRYSH